jgi:undecaprenyl-diphosphatase
MFGASLLKIMHYGLAFSFVEIFYLIAAMVIAFVVSLYSIKFLMNYVKNHDFKFFGYYRIVLGVIVLVYFGLMALLGL